LLPRPVCPDRFWGSFVRLIVSEDELEAFFITVDFVINGASVLAEGSTAESDAGVAESIIPAAEFIG